MESMAVADDSARRRILSLPWQYMPWSCVQAKGAFIANGPSSILLLEMSAEVPKLHDRTVGRVGNLSRVVLPLAVAIGFPAYLLSTNRLIPFANDFHCDPWDYFGMFYLAGQTSMLNPLSRVLSRVPEFLIGNISTALLPGIAADYGNFIVIYVGSVLALYFAVSRTFGPLPAMIAATFLGTNAILVGNLSTTLFSPSILYNVIAILFARRASDCRGLRRTLN